MAKVSKEFKQAIERMPVGDLVKLVTQMAVKNQEAYDLIYHKYVGGKEAEQEFFEAIKDKALGEIWLVSDRGNLQRNLARGIGRAVKHINYFSKITNNKAAEAELLLALLDELFSDYSNLLGTCWTVFDSKLAATTNRLYNLVMKRLNEDYLIEYQKPLNKFLKILHEKSNHLNFIYNMPLSI